MRIRLILVAAALFGVAVGAEGFARYVLGLGDPPLTIRDPQIEYLFAPSRCYKRFGNRVCFNKWSMRSASFPKQRAPGEFRVLIFGDSVVNGGSLTDQDDLATEIIHRETRATVGNVSAGSWGPANVLAYIKRFGWFDATAAVFVFSSQDLTDVPLFPADLGPDLPETTPPLAIIEAATRYLPQYIPSLRAAPVSSPPAPPDDPGADVVTLLETAKSEVHSVCLLFHHEVPELTTIPPQIAIYQSLAEQAGVPFFVLQENPTDYRDNIHLTVEGQRHLAEQIRAHCAL
jgi:hypothetical protein